MTDETEQPDYTPVEDADSLLQLLVSIANKGTAFPITLLSNGVIVSGTMIGRKAYMEQFTEHFTTGWAKEDADFVKDAFGVNDPPSDDDQPADSVRYIHLVNAKIFTPGQPPIPQEGFLWRGKLIDVSGFSYGSFSNSPN